jgi:hypothetical protein
MIIQEVPNLWRSLANRNAKRVSGIGMKISPPWKAERKYAVLHLRCSRSSYGQACFSSGDTSFAFGCSPWVIIIVIFPGCLS